MKVCSYSTEVHSGVEINNLNTLGGCNQRCGKIGLTGSFMLWTLSTEGSIR